MQSSMRRRRARPPAQDLPVEKTAGLAVPGTEAETQWAKLERQRLVHRALQSMSALNREVIILKEMQGLRLEDIAQMLDLPLGTVKSRSSRARVELTRRVLELTGENGAGARS